MACLLQMFNIVKKLNPSIIKPITFATNRAILLNKLKVTSPNKIVLICLKRTKTQVGVTNLVCHSFPRIFSTRIYCQSKYLEQFSIKCPKTKIKVILPDNHKLARQCSEPIKERSNNTMLMQRGETCEKTSLLALVLSLIGWKVARAVK